MIRQINWCKKNRGAKVTFTFDWASLFLSDFIGARHTRGEAKKTRGAKVTFTFDWTSLFLSDFIGAQHTRGKMWQMWQICSIWSRLVINYFDVDDSLGTMAVTTTRS